MGVWAGYVIGEDEHGVWLFTPAGSRYQAEHNGTVIGVCEVGQGSRPAGSAVMQLLPRSGWWVAHVYGVHDPDLFAWPVELHGDRRGERAVAVDVCRPAVHRAGIWTYVDLELDVLGNGAGGVIIEDEDEFADACAAGVISTAEAVAARATAGELAAWLTEGVEPFGRRAWQRWESALALGLEPLTELPTPRPGF
jgi:hypothetical protein